MTFVARSISELLRMRRDRRDFTSRIHEAGHTERAVNRIGPSSTHGDNTAGSRLPVRLKRSDFGRRSVSGDRRRHFVRASATGKNLQ